MGDRSETDIPQGEESGGVGWVGASRFLGAALDWRRRLERRCRDADLLDEIAKLAAEEADACVLQTYLEEAGGLLRTHLDGPLTEEWSGIFLRLQSRFANLAASRGVSGVLGLHRRSWRTSWNEAVENARRTRAVLRGSGRRDLVPAVPNVPASVEREASKKGAPPPPSGGAPRKAAVGSGAVVGPGAGRSLPSDTAKILGGRASLVVTGVGISPQVIDWLQRELGPKGFREARSERGQKGPRRFRSDIEAIKTGKICAVVFCYAHMTHSAFGAIRSAANVHGLPHEVVFRPTREMLVEAISAAVVRLRQT